MTRRPVTTFGMRRIQWPCSPGAHGVTPAVCRRSTSSSRTAARDLLGERMHQHAPAAAGALVDVVDLEGDPRVVGGRGDLRGIGADDDGVAVEHVVDRKDQRERAARETDAPELAGGQELAALVGGQHDECPVPRAVLRRILRCHGTPPRVRPRTTVAGRHRRSPGPKGPAERYGSARRVGSSSTCPAVARHQRLERRRLSAAPRTAAAPRARGRRTARARGGRRRPRRSGR